MTPKIREPSSKPQTLKANPRNFELQTEAISFKQYPEPYLKPQTLLSPEHLTVPLEILVGSICSTQLLGIRTNRVFYMVNGMSKSILDRVKLQGEAFT